jgi:hypothetical protein
MGSGLGMLRNSEELSINADAKTITLIPPSSPFEGQALTQGL